MALSNEDNLKYVTGYTGEKPSQYGHGWGALSALATVKKHIQTKILIDNPKLLRMTLKCLSSTITYWRHGRSSATQVERVFWLVNGFPTDSYAFSNIELFDCVIYKLIDTATWRWYCSVIGLFYFVVSHNTQTYFRLQGQYAGGLSLLIGRFPLCLLVLFILRINTTEDTKVQKHEVNLALLLPPFHFWIYLGIET